MSGFSEENKDAKERVTFFLSLILDAQNSSLSMIKDLSDEAYYSVSNSKLYLVTFACNKISEIIDKLPEGEIKTFLRNETKRELEKLTCYVIDKNSSINCNDFYEIFLKRKNVNKEILKKVKKIKGGFGGLMLGIAITALALLQTTTSVSGALFNGDNFVQQRRAEQGYHVLEAFQKASQETPNLKIPLTREQGKEFARLSINIHGVCVTNAYLAELCTGGCPSKEELEKFSPDLFGKVRKAYRKRLTFDVMKPEENKLSRVFEAPPINLMLGLNSTSDLYERNLIKVPDGFDMEWFKNYFRNGVAEHFSEEKREKSSSDMVIATVENRNHAFNVMYNIKEDKLCVHDENYKVDWSDSDFYVQENSGEYICEKGFFKKYQIKELNKLNKKSEIVHETSENIFEKYYERIKEFDKTEDNKIKLIQPLESIFLLDNSKNTGNTDEYIEILKEVRRSIIEGEKEGLAILENQKEKLKISDEVLEIMERAVKVHEESWDLGIEDFDGNESLQKIKDIQEELDTALNKKEGGSKIYFTSTVRRKRKKRKNKSKTKRKK